MGVIKSFFFERDRREKSPLAAVLGQGSLDDSHYIKDNF